VLGDTVRETMQPLVPTYTLPDDRYAVVVNANAGRVTPRLARRLRSVVPAHRLHLTESPEHAEQVVQHCVEQEVGTIFAGGGDGTIVGVINSLNRLQTDAPLPRVGVLRLGTGNALARWLGSGQPMRDLLRWQGGMVHRAVPVSMVETEGDWFPFGGLGQDAAVLNDYNALKSEHAHQPWWPLLKGVSGYFAAALLKTIPQWLGRERPRVTVTNLGAPASRVGPDGVETGPPIPTGGVLYQGSCSMLGVATTPLLGYGMRMFPHATRRAGRFQLRILDTSPLQSLRHLPAAWKGTLDTPRLTDLYADRVRVVFDTAMPWQLAGEAQGYRRELTFGIAEMPITLVGQA